MKWRENRLAKWQAQYGSIAIFGILNNAKSLVEFLGDDIIKKYISCFLLSKVRKEQEFFYEVPIESVYHTDFPKNGLIIIACDVSIRKEIEDVLESVGFQNYIYISEFREQFDDDRIRDYVVDFKTSRPLFKTIEIETINRCNGICEFCPVNRNEKQRPYHKMSDEMFYSIINQLEKLNYQGTVSLFSNNEPFIDERIIDFAKYTREKLPQARLSIYTNGTLLTEEKYRAVIPFLDIFWIDIYTTNDNEEVPPHIQNIMRIAQEEQWNKKTTLSIMKYDMVRFSRGGMSPNSKVEYILDRPCILPYVQMVVRPDGKISLCCNDALGKMTLGDLTQQSLTDVWYGEKYNRIRELVHNGRENVELCKYCNYIQDLDSYSI